MKVTDVNFRSPTFEPAVGTKEFGTPAPTSDILTTAKPAETGEGCIYRMICCIPRCIRALVQKLLCILTLGWYCNPKPLTEKQKKEQILVDAEAVQKIWNSDDPIEKKKEVAEALYQKYPEIKDAIALVGANNDRDAAFNLKPHRNEEEKKENEKAIKEWNESGRAKSLAQMNEALDRYDSGLLFSYIKRLREQIEETK